MKNLKTDLMQTFMGNPTLKYHLNFTKAYNSGSELLPSLCSSARKDQYFWFLCLKPPPSDGVKRSKQQKEKKKNTACVKQLFWSVVFLFLNHLSCFGDYQLQRESWGVQGFDDRLEKMAAPLQSVTDRYEGGVLTRERGRAGERRAELWGNFERKRIKSKNRWKKKKKKKQPQKNIVHQLL